MKKMTIMVTLVLLFGISLAVIIPFNLINEQRIKNGLTALKIDNGLQKVARIKTF